jgi:hypothetical protein
VSAIERQRAVAYRIAIEEATDTGECWPAPCEGDQYVCRAHGAGEVTFGTACPGCGEPATEDVTLADETVRLCSECAELAQEFGIFPEEG